MKQQQVKLVKQQMKEMKKKYIDQYKAEQDERQMLKHKINKELEEERAKQQLSRQQ